MPTVQLLHGGANEPRSQAIFQSLTLVAELGRAPAFEVAVERAEQGQRAIERAHCEDKSRLRIQLCDNDWLGPGGAQTDWRLTGGTATPLQSGDGYSKTLCHLFGRYLEPALEAWLNRSFASDGAWILWQRGMGETLDHCLRRICGGHMVAGDRLNALAGAPGIPPVAAWVRPARWTNREFLDAFVAQLRLHGLSIEGWQIDGPRANLIDLVAKPADAEGSNLDLNSWDIAKASGGTFALDGLTPPNTPSVTVLTRRVTGNISVQQVAGFSFGDKRNVRVGDMEIPRKPGVLRIAQADGPGSLFLARRIELNVRFDNTGLIKTGQCSLWLESLTRVPPCTALPNARVEARFLGWDETGSWARLEPAPDSAWTLLKEWLAEPQAETNGLFVAALAQGRQRENIADGLFLALQEEDVVSVRIESGLHPVIEGVVQKKAFLDDSRAAVLRVREQSLDVDAATVSVAQNVEVTKAQAGIKGKLVADQDATFKGNVNLV